MARIDWALTTKVGTVNTANSENIYTRVDHHLLSSEVSEKEVKPAIRYLRGKQVFFSQKWVVLLPFSPKEFFLLLQSPSIKCSQNLLPGQPAALAAPWFVDLCVKFPSRPSARMSLTKNNHSRAKDAAWYSGLFFVLAMSYFLLVNARFGQ